MYQRMEILYYIMIMMIINDINLALMIIIYNITNIYYYLEYEYYNAYIQNLEKWYWRIYLQGSSGETDIENRLMDTGRGEERVRYTERVTWKLTLPYVK